MRIDWAGFEYIKPRKNKFRKLAETINKSVEEQLLELSFQSLSLTPSYKSGVYVFHSKANDFIYIGSAVNLEKRHQSHIYDLKMNQHVNWMFQLTYHRYGLDNLSFYIMELCPSKECLQREQKLIYECDPEINIEGVRWETLGLDFKSMNEQQDVYEEWLQTEKGKEYKRNTIEKKRAKWFKTPVGRNCVRQDIKNLRDRLNKTSLTQDEKVEEILDYFREYFPTMPIKKDTLIKFINEGTPFEPVWGKVWDSFK